MSISNYLEEAWLNTLRGGGLGTDYTAPTGVFVKLHITGDPGEDGTATPALNTERQPATFAAASNPTGTITTSADIDWVSVSNTETYFGVSLWDNITDGVGNCLWTGLLTTSKAVTAGDTFTIAAGDLTLTLE